MTTSQDDPWDNPLHERYKTRPCYRDVDYPHYEDLNNFIKQQGTEEKITILDYGAGASPYQKYFPNSDYRRADITGASSLQYIIGADSVIKEEDSSFDLILSTQVAEHVPNPDVYFNEAHRLLRSTGKFLLTTHGVWEEHGSPYDYQRWTASGLRRDLEKSNFTGIRIFKITCGFRSTLLFLTRSLFATTPPSGKINELTFKILRTLYSKTFPFLYRVADCWWPEDKIVEVKEGMPDPAWYVVIAVIASK